MRWICAACVLSACWPVSEDGCGDYRLVNSELGSVRSISGLAAARDGGETELWAVSDAAVSPSLIYGVRVEDDALTISSQLTLTLDGDPVSLDLEGIDVDPAGGWWVAVEGEETAVAGPNLLLHVDESGAITGQVTLPDEVAAWQEMAGFEGVAVNDDGSALYVAFQAGWGEDSEGNTRIGRYTPASDSWAFYHYPLGAGAGGSGISELAWAGEDRLVVMERDDQAGDEAEIKWLTVVSVAELDPAPVGDSPSLLLPGLLRDLVAEDCWPFEKAEGIALVGGDVIIVNDNDGDDDEPTVALVVDQLAADIGG